VEHRQSACSASRHAFIAERTRFFEIPQNGSGPEEVVPAVSFTKLLALLLPEHFYVQASILA
jgi:hypothetical protein